MKDRQREWKGKISAHKGVGYHEEPVSLYKHTGTYVIVKVMANLQDLVLMYAVLLTFLKKKNCFLCLNSWSKDNNLTLDHGDKQICYFLN